MIAKVNEKVIVAADVEKEMDAILAQYQQKIPPEQLKAMLPRLRKQAIDSIINRHLLHDEVERKDIPPAPDRVDGEIKKIAARFPSQEAFEEQLTVVGITLDQMKKDLEQQFKVDVLIRDYITGKDIQLPKDDVAKFFEENPQAFQKPEQVRARHILLKTTPEETQDVKSQKRLQLAGLQGQIAKGADFGKMAEQHSECPSKAQGGDLGLFSRGKMVQAFEDTAFGLKTGEISDIVETQFGFHLIKLEERQEPHQQEFEEVKDQIVNHMMAEKEQAAFRDFVDELRSDATIEYTEEAEAEAEA